MPILRLELYKKVERHTDMEQHKMFEYVLRFDGGYAFASADELLVKKRDGTIFRSDIVLYESDPLTTTYIGHFPNKQPFRFVFASETNPMATLDPMVSFGSMSTSGWAIHYRVKP